jgi:hypothetical protein
MKYGDGSVFASDVVARVNSRCIVASTVSEVVPAEEEDNARRGIKLNNKITIADAIHERRFIRLVDPLFNFSINHIHILDAVNGQTDYVP